MFITCRFLISCMVTSTHRGQGQGSRRVCRHSRPELNCENWSWFQRMSSRVRLCLPVPTSTSFYKPSAQAFTLLCFVFRSSRAEGVPHRCQRAAESPRVREATRCLARRSRVGSTLLRWDCSPASCDFCLTTVNEFTSTNTHRSVPSADQSDGKAVSRVSRHYPQASPGVGVSGLPQCGVILNTITASRETSQQSTENEGDDGLKAENCLDLP